MPTYKIVPFAAQINRGDTTSQVAAQMQKIIDSYVTEGWEYIRMDGVQTSVAGTDGCFGFGAQPGFTTTYNVLVFKQ
jgi:hypothetical protein